LAVSSDGASGTDSGSSDARAPTVDGSVSNDGAVSDDEATADDSAASEEGSAAEASSEVADAGVIADFDNADATSTPASGATYSTADCYNHYRKELTLTTDWVEYKVRFTEMHQDPNFGYIAPFAINQIYSFAIAVPPGTTFDVWIDDLAWWRATDP